MNPASSKPSDCEPTLTDLFPGATEEPAISLLQRAASLFTPLETDYPAECSRGHAVVQILQVLELDMPALLAGLFLPLLEARVIDCAALTDRLDPDVGKLGERVLRLTSLREYSHTVADAGQADKLRKMWLTMAQDPRVVVILLAARLDSLRSAKRAPVAYQHEIANEALQLYAPLAGRLGIWQFKWEMEDLAFRYLQPETYQRLAKALDQRRQDRERYIRSTIAQLRTELAAAGIQAEIAGRPKHIYSIWKKMQTKQLDFEQLFDVLAVRVLVEAVADCYAALSLVQSLWSPIASEFDDYIAKPKPNGYQSLHTAVQGPEDRPLEVQIRTRAMHQDAELGIAAHWRYKERSRANNGHIAWLKGFLEQQDEDDPKGDLIERFKAQAFHDRIYVLTPQGRIVDLPQGATALDFAYALHTELGHRCRGAKVDGSIIPLVQPLQSGQQVEILTTRQGAPSRDWLSPGLGYLRTDSARTKVKRWFKQQDHTKHVAQGRDVIDRELRRAGGVEIDFDEIARHFRMNAPEDLYAALGRGEITSGQLEHYLRERIAPSPELDELPLPRKPQRGSVSGIQVLGVSNLLTRFAGCCKPVPNDPIVGYITQGQGISIHRADCRNLRSLHRTQEQRFIEVAWNVSPGLVYATEVLIDASDIKGLLRNITDVISSEHINITAVNSAPNRIAHSVRISLTVEISNAVQLERMLHKLRQLPEVQHAGRKFT